MTRRITVAMIAVVVATLLVAGLTTFGLTQARAAHATEANLVRQLDDLGVGVNAIEQFLQRLEAAARARQANRRGPTTTTQPGAAPTTTAPPRALDAQGCPVRALRRALQVRDAECILVEPDGTVVTAQGFPPVVGLPARLDAADVASLGRGGTPHGVNRGTAWAARAVLTQPRPGSAGLPVIVLAQDVRSQLAPVRRWLVVAAIVALALGLAVALWLGRRLSRPLVAAQRATARIAAGDLSVRLPEQPGDAAGADGDALAGLHRTINRMAASLERSRGMEQQFLLSVSHDLRTPLTSIRGYAEALADGTLDDVGRGAAVIGQEAARLERLVRDLLELARLESHQFSLELGPVDLVDVARAAVAAFVTDAEQAGIRLTLAGPPAEPSPARPAPVAGRSSSTTVLADRDRLGLVAANLVENALKYADTAVVVEIDVAVVVGGASVRQRPSTPSAGDGGSDDWTTIGPGFASRAGLTTPAGRSSVDGWVVLAVIDDGPGIAEEDLPHVFDRLYVARRSPQRKESGSGLGLAIVRELVGAFGGTVAARPAGPGRRGTRVEVCFPRAETPRPRDPLDETRGSGSTRAGA
jgi:two-component system sensor histidine kinase BaeS